MNKQKHSPLPWQTDAEYCKKFPTEALPGDIEDDSCNEILDKDRHTVCDMRSPHIKDDANFIVEACNNYKRLKGENDRIRKALEWIQHHKEQRDDWWIEQVLDHIEKQLKQEGGENDN